MNIEKGKFIRKNGMISKVIDIIDEDYFRIDSITYMLKIEDNIKIRDNIIDLIEEKDLVNGYVVYKTGYVEIYVITEDGIKKIKHDDIKKVTTHEQIEAHSYKLGDEK